MCLCKIMSFIFCMNGIYNVYAAHISFLLIYLTEIASNNSCIELKSLLQFILLKEIVVDSFNINFIALL